MRHILSRDKRYHAYQKEIRDDSIVVRDTSAVQYWTVHSADSWHGPVLNFVYLYPFMCHVIGLFSSHGSLRLTPIQFRWVQTREDNPYVFVINVFSLFHLRIMARSMGAWSRRNCTRFRLQFRPFIARVTIFCNFSRVRTAAEHDNDDVGGTHVEKEHTARVCVPSNLYLIAQRSVRYIVTSTCLYRDTTARFFKVPVRASCTLYKYAFR